MDSSLLSSTTSRSALAHVNTSVICYNHSDITNHYCSSAASNMTERDEVMRFDECDPDLPLCQAQRVLFMVFGPILLLMSVVGGCLGVAVMTRNALKKTASAVFIASLSISDMSAVLTGLIRHFTLKATGVSRPMS